MARNSLNNSLRPCGAKRIMEQNNLMQLYNFLSRKIEKFMPIGKTVGLYTCGPTVYDFVHIGNWRTFIFEDILKRVLSFNGYKVKHVMNITDIDDKIIKGARDQGIEFRELGQRYEKTFFEDLERLNILKADIYPRATENIDWMVRIIEILIDKGFAYKSDDGVYFAVENFKNYGKLSGLSKRNLKKGARIDSDQYDKESWADFALWKFPSSATSDTKAMDVKKASEDEPFWEAPFGRGRPGWHIECSAMAQKYLGDAIDIHTGGVDLLFPHHENEIAQSEAQSDKKFVNFWLEGEHLLVEGEKMAKSLGNIFTIADVIKRNFEPLALRYLFLTAHYRSKLNFTWKSLEAAQNTLENLREEVINWNDPKIARLPATEAAGDVGQGCAEFEGNFTQAINNDLDIPKAISVMWKMIKSDYPTSAKYQSILVMDKAFGLGLDKLKKLQMPKGVRELVEKREELRSQRKFVESDNMRSQLEKMGVLVEDTPQGPKFKIKKKHHKI